MPWNLPLRVPHSLRGWQRVRVLNDCLEESIGTPLRATPSAFHHVQLLPASSLATHGEEARCFLEDSRRSADALPVLTGRLRGDAGTYSSTDFRARCGESEHGDASSEATRGAIVATERPASES